jgi:hypothetical protein
VQHRPGDRAHQPVPELGRRPSPLEDEPAVQRGVAVEPQQIGGAVDGDAGRQAADPSEVVGEGPRWAGADVGLSQRIPSDLIMAAAEADRSIGAEIGPYLSMRAGPESLDAVEPRAREVYRSGWRPRRAEGPAAASSPS